MRWLAIWLLLTGTWLAGWAALGWLDHRGVALNAESLAHLIAVPLAQTAALRGLAAFRRMFREAGAATQEVREEEEDGAYGDVGSSSPGKS